MNQPQKKSGIFQWIDVNDWPKYEAEGWTVVSRMISFMSYDSLGIVKEDKLNEVTDNMKSAFGGYYECQKNKKHKANLYFFDSKPKEVRCPQCDNGNQQKLIRELDMGKAASKTLKKWRSIAKKTNPTA